MGQLDPWVCSYCPSYWRGFCERGEWVQHLEDYHGIKEDSIVEPWDRRQHDMAG